MYLVKRPSLLSYRHNNIDSFHSLQTEVIKLANNIFNESAFTKVSWSPHVDIKETNHDIIITADLPGARKEDIEISLCENILTIKGERKFKEYNQDSEKAYIKERCYGHFERSFSLPEVDVEKNGVQAEMKNGELTITLHKLPAAQKEICKIEVK